MTSEPLETQDVETPTIVNFLIRPSRRAYLVVWLLALLPPVFAAMAGDALEFFLSALMVPFFALAVSIWLFLWKIRLTDDRLILGGLPWTKVVPRRALAAVRPKRTRSGRLFAMSLTIAGGKRPSEHVVIMIWYRRADAEAVCNALQDWVANPTPPTP